MVEQRQQSNVDVEKQAIQGMKRGYKSMKSRGQLEVPMQSVVLLY